MANYLSKKLREPFAAWLADTTPDQWHRVADAWNWGNGEDPLRWIVEQPECDRATALLIFWRGSPDYFWKHPTLDAWLESGEHFPRDTYEMLVSIVSRWRAGGFTRATIAYDPGSDWGASPSDVEKSRRHPALAISPSMIERLPGSIPSGEDLDEGVPVTLAA